MRRTIAFITGGVVGFIIIEIIQILIITVAWRWFWEHYLKDHLPKSWVENYYMIGFGHHE